PLRSAPVADQSQKLDREAPGELVLACAGDPARLEVGQYGIESHAREMTAVTLRLVGSGARERVCHDHRRERDTRRLLVLVDAHPDVLMDSHVTGLASSRPRTGGHALAAPAHLLGAAPVERGAVVPLAREVKHLGSECAEVYGGA